MFQMFCGTFLQFPFFNTHGIMSVLVCTGFTRVLIARADIGFAHGAAALNISTLVRRGEGFRRVGSIS